MLGSHITDVTSLTYVALFLPAGQSAGHVQPVGFVVDKVHWHVFFLRILRYLPVIILPMFHTHTSFIYYQGCRVLVRGVKKCASKTDNCEI